LLTALTRSPTDALTRCELTHLGREPIDVARAIAQHGAYEELLTELGAKVVKLPPEPDMPDAVFVEDVAIVLDEVAVMMCPGAISRRLEIESVARTVEQYRPVERVTSPGTIDGGDVLRVERVLYVGLSERTNAEAIAQLSRIVGDYGYGVTAVPVTSCLHLKSACSYVGDGTVLLNPEWLAADAFAEFDLIEVPETELRGANTFFVGQTIVMASSFPETLERLQQRGRQVRTVDLSELQKAEAGGSCMSIVFEP
jgi:dimethylargininase